MRLAATTFTTSSGAPEKASRRPLEPGDAAGSDCFPRAMRVTLAYLSQTDRCIGIDELIAMFHDQGTRPWNQLLSEKPDQARSDLSLAITQCIDLERSLRA